MLAVVVYLPILHKPFGTFSLTWQDWCIIGMSALTIFPVIEITKWIIRKGKY